MNKTSKIFTYFRKKFQPDLPFPEQDLLVFWQERICFATFLSAVVLMAIPYVLVVIQLFREERWLHFAVYTLGYLLLLVITLLRRFIPYNIRAWIGIALFYSFGIMPLLTIGPISSGRIYLFAFAIVTVILLGSKAGLAALALNICTIVVVSLLASTGRLEWASRTPYAVEIWKNSGSTFVFLNSIVTVALLVLIHNLERGIRNEQKLTGELSAANLQIERENAEERKLQLEALENEAKYRLLAENTVDCIWTLNMNLEFTYINQAIFHYLGYTPEEWTGSKLAEHSPPEQMDKMKGIIADVLADLSDKTTAVFETSFYHKNGEEVPGEVMGKVLLDDAGNAIGFQGTTHDITERRKAEESLRKRKEFLDTILDSVQTGIIIVDPETHEFLDANNAAVEMMGIPKEQIIGRICNEYFYPDGKGTCSTTDLMQQGDNSESILFRPDGGEVPIIKTIVLTELSGKECLLINFINITEKKKLEGQLQQAQKMEAIGTLAGGISHDFNNILSPIIGYTELAMDDVEEGSQLQEEIAAILKGAIRAKELVKQILTFSRQQAQEFKPLRVQAVIQEAMKLIKSSLPATIEISQNIDMGCGLVMADYTQIHQLVMNLCTNAYHAMEETGGRLEVTLAEMEVQPGDVLNKFSLKAGRYVKLTLSDTGHGMEPEVLRRIFDPYFTTKENGKGTGLGLAVVHGIVKESGGELKVYSEPGRGSVFHIFLPLIDAKGAETQAVPVEKSEGGSERILLIDDEEMIVSLEKKILERLGYQVTDWTSSREALEAFRAEPDGFDLVITDLTMPDISGEELIRELLNIRHDIPVILCTGFSEKTSEREADIPGVKAFLLKPVLVGDLTRTVRQVLDNN